MEKKSQGPNPIDQDIKNNEFHNIYVLYGVEDYLKLQYRDKLIKAVMPTDDGMNLSRMEGKDLDVKDLINAAETMPFFADRRVIVVNGSGLFKKSNDELAEYLEHVCNTTVLIFVESEVDARVKTFKAAQKAGATYEFVMPDDMMLKKWIATKLKNDGVEMTGDAYQTFFEMTSDSMSNMATEYEKLIAFVGEGKRVEKSDVQNICTRQITTRIFDMINAMAVRDSKTAFDLYQDMLQSGSETPLGILALICNQYKQLLTIGELDARGLNFNDIGSKMKISPYAVKYKLPLLKKMSAKEIKALLNDAADYERKVKSGLLDDQLAVELLMMKYSRKESA